MKMFKGFCLLAACVAMVVFFSTPALTDEVVVTEDGKVGIGTSLPAGKLDVMGDIRAGNSDIYFTKIDHTCTVIGNTAGYAAIQNAADFDSLMILGRAGTPKGRYVRLWDYLQINGSMDITGNVGIGTNAPAVSLHITRGTDSSITSGGFLVTGSLTGASISIDNNEIMARNNGAVSPLYLQYDGGNTIMNLVGGNVGIGTTNPLYKLDVNGVIRGSNVAASDARWKENVETIDGSLERVSQLRGVSYEWIDKSHGEGRQVGVIAQEVETVFPEVVHTDSQGYKSVEYAKLVAPLIEAVKELKEENKLLKANLQELSSRLSDLEKN